MTTSGPKDNQNEFRFWSKIFNIKFKKLTKMTDDQLYKLTKDTKDDFVTNSDKYRKLLNDHLKDEYTMPHAQGKENSIFIEIKKMMNMPEDKLYTKVRAVKKKYEEKPIKLDNLPKLANLILSAYPRTQEHVENLVEKRKSILDERESLIAPKAIRESLLREGLFNLERMSDKRNSFVKNKSCCCQCKQRKFNSAKCGPPARCPRSKGAQPRSSRSTERLLGYVPGCHCKNKAGKSSGPGRGSASARSPSSKRPSRQKNISRNK